MILNALHHNNSKATPTKNAMHFSLENTTHLKHIVFEINEK